jgi:hypothetical protein
MGGIKENMLTYGSAMTKPLSPPPELVLQWLGEFFNCTFNAELSSSELFLTTRAAQWGADQELEACCEWLENVDCDDPQETAKLLRAVRRPKPPTLNSIALQMLGTIERDAHYLPEITDTIRRALEQLDD